MPSTITSTSNTNESDHNLKDLLSREILIDAFEWKTTDPTIPLWLGEDDYISGSENFMKQYILPQALLDKSSLVRQKLNNFLYMRSDIEIEVKVNSNPFQQGELLLAYFPKSLDTTRFRATANEFLASVTSAPHTYIKLEQGNSMKMTIPYANVLEHLDLSKPDNIYGVINLYCTSKLKGPVGIEKAVVNVRARFVTPEVYVPTDNSLLSNQRYMELEIQAINKIKNRITQVNNNGKWRAQMSEGEKEGPVSKIAGTIASVGEALTPIPVIGRVAEVTSWVARAAQGVATYFGWSKPVSQIMPRPIVNRPAAYMGNTEGQDASHVLAQISDNAIDSTAMVPSDTDELALGTIFSRPNTIFRKTITKNDFVGKNLLFSWEVSPFAGYTQQPYSNGQDFALGSFSFASMMARFWRGSIVYSLRAIKTQYHSGRIVAVYFPNRTVFDIPETLNEEITTNSNIIFDLQAKSQEEFSLEKPIVIPYTSNEPWKRTLWKDLDTGLYDARSLNTSCGIVGVYCYNELVCPENVAQEVTFMLSVKAGSDYELSLPQIQLQGGFASSVQINIGAEIANAINSAYPVDFYTLTGAIGTTPDFVDSSGGTDTVIRQSGGVGAEWLLLEGQSTALPDGIHSDTLFIDWTSNVEYYADGNASFTVEVRDGLFVSCVSDYLTVYTDIPIEDAVSVAVSEIVFEAQMGDPGASQPIPDESFMAKSIPHKNTSQHTTGEYFSSLRPLLKRFCKTAKIDATTPVTFHPFQFSNYESSTPNLPNGQRVWTTETGGNTLRESWVSLISYLYRFSAGSSRFKTFIPFDCSVQTSLDVKDSLYIEFGSEQMDPVFVTHGMMSSAVEAHLPYYSQYKARTIGDQVQGECARLRVEFSKGTEYDYFEAAGDDYNMWFMIGPPVMRPHDVDQQPLTTIGPAQSRNSLAKANSHKVIPRDRL
jgi:hypothetical protein